jgi:hypothetical protein
MNTPTVTTDALELMLRLNETTRDFVLAVKALHRDIENLKLQTVKSPLYTLKEAAEFIKMSPQYIMQGATGKGYPPPNCIEICGPRGSGGKPKLLFEHEELERWRRDAPRRYSEESQERRLREYEDR